MRTREERELMTQTGAYSLGYSARKMGLTDFSQNPYVTEWFRECWELGWNHADIDECPDEFPTHPFVGGNDN